MGGEQVERVVVLTDADIEALAVSQPVTPETPCVCGATQPAHYCSVNAAAKAKLRKALEQPQGEVRYRVRYFNAATAPLPTLDAAEEALEEMTDVRPTAIQSQACGPWTDIDQQEEER